MSRRALSLQTRLLRAAAWVVANTEPARCTCAGGSTGKYSHAAHCYRWVHLRVRALLERHGFAAYADTTLDAALEALEAVERGGMQGGARTSWKGGGDDPVVEAWLAQELAKARAAAQRARMERRPSGAHDARVRALRHVRTALRRYARDGTQIVDMTRHPDEERTAC